MKERLTRRKFLRKLPEIAASVASVAYLTRNERTDRRQERTINALVESDWVVARMSETRDLTILTALNQTREEAGLKPYTISQDGKLVIEG